VIPEEAKKTEIVPLDTEEEYDEEKISKIMGFSSFSTTKNQSHVESTEEAVMKSSSQKRKYRQYMNRKGGFNRPLDKMV